MFYEVMLILNTENGDEGIEKAMTRFSANVTKNEGEIIRIDDLGIKTMAYKIQKRSRARYMLCYLEGPGSMMSELERTLKIDDNVLRFLLIKLEDDVKREDLEKVEAEPAPAPVEAPVAEAAPVVAEAPKEAPAAAPAAAPEAAPEATKEGE